MSKWKMENVVESKSFAFAVKMIRQTREMRSQGCGETLVNQILRSGTSIGTNVSEAQQAQSKKDFISKMSIALKEANETRYWLRLLKETHSLQQETADLLTAQASEMISLLTKIVKSARES